jgi:hypothetical protein
MSTARAFARRDAAGLCRWDDDGEWCPDAAAAGAFYCTDHLWKVELVSRAFGALR